MHGEVVAPAAVLAVLAELAGAVERVDDPDALGGQPDGVVGGLLGQDRVTGTGLGERRREPRLRGGVAGVRRSSVAPASGSSPSGRSASAWRRRPSEHLAGTGRQGGGEPGVVECGQVAAARG